MTAVGLGECRAFLGKCKHWALDTKQPPTISPRRPFAASAARSARACRCPWSAPPSVRRTWMPWRCSRRTSSGTTTAASGATTAGGTCAPWIVPVPMRRAQGLSAGRTSGRTGTLPPGSAPTGDTPSAWAWAFTATRTWRGSRRGMVKLHPFDSVTPELCVGEPDALRCRRWLPRS